jgi:2-dehydro-3-deoxygalactonokinase
MPHLIAVDWGTSSLRGAQLDETGRVLEEKSAPLGILNVPNGDFAGVFAAQFSDWMKPAGTRCLISGMAGSRQGWVEAPYAAPQGPTSWPSTCLDRTGSHRHRAWPQRRAGRRPDVMRGE